MMIVVIHGQYNSLAGSISKWWSEQQGHTFANDGGDEQ